MTMLDIPDMVHLIYWYDKPTDVRNSSIVRLRGNKTSRTNTTEIQ